MKRHPRSPLPRSAWPFAGTLVLAVLAAFSLMEADLTVQAADSMSYLPDGPGNVLPARLFE